MEQSIKFPQRRNQSRDDDDAPRNISRDIFKRARRLFTSRVPNHYFARLVDHNVKSAVKEALLFSTFFAGIASFCGRSSSLSSILRNLSTLRFRPIIIRVPPAIPSMTFSVLGWIHFMASKKLLITAPHIT